MKFRSLVKKIICLSLHVAALTAAFSQSKPIYIYEGVPKGSESWTQQEREMLYPGTDILLVQNVVRPSLRIFLPAKEKATGTAIVLEPGGGWETIVEGVEGNPVADSLTAHGITVFMLRYRIFKTIDNFLYTADKKSGLASETRIKDYTEKLKAFDLEDIKTAMKYVRSHATEYGVKPDRVGVMGFSAGAFNVSVLAAEYDADTRPDFVAPIYGAIESFTVPADAPPVFLAHASDDKLVPVARSINFYEQWNKAGKHAEIHIFAQGGHGFGVSKKGLPVDNWIALFFQWLKSEGLL